MKKYKFFALAFAALTLGACSSDDVVDNGQGGIVPAGEPGYVSLAINLPTQPSSRANDDFSNGEAVEYNVNNGYLLLFAGSSESSATFQSAYSLTDELGTWNDRQEGSNITTSSRIIKEITRPSVSGNIYAFVILNGSGVVNEGTNETTGWQYCGNSLSGNTTLATLTSTAISPDIATIANRSDDGNFLMTNAPLFSAPGGTSAPTGGTVSTFSVVDPDNIYSTQAEAERLEPAANIYVERAVAKVTVTGTTSGTSPLTYSIAGWTLDVTNNSTYLVRNVNPQTAWWEYKSTDAGVNDYRFVGSNPVATGLYRTYWGIDPNYNGQDYGQTPFTMLEGGVPSTLTLTGDTNPLYCFENTFNVANMIQNQTTRVVVAADLELAGADGTSHDFYTVRGNTSTIYDGKEDVEALVKKAYLENATIAAAINNATMTGPGVKIGESDLDVTFDSKVSTGGYLTVTEISVNDDGAAKFADGVPAALQDANNNAIVTAISEDLNIAYYKGGRSYYPVMIRHFDESQTPWNLASDQTESYPTPNAEQNWLGRWGVLRNNWYQINVTGVSQIGYPEVPEVPGSYDDPVESWIAVQINVLSWAVRTQEAEL